MMTPSVKPAPHPRRAWRLTLLGLAAVAGSAIAQGMSFSQAYEAALAYDAAYRAAGHELSASQFNVPIARASLLPQLNFNASDANVRGSRQFPNGLNQEVRTRLDYSAPQASLSLRMPLFNYEAYSGFRQAQAQSDLAAEVYRAQGMDLIERLAGAYLQQILSDENRRLAETQVASLETQMQQTEQRQQRGEGTRVQVAQIQANLDVGRARLLEAIDQQDLARRQLGRLTGVKSSELPRLPAEPTPVPLFPDRLGDWIEMAVLQSPQLRGRERAAEVARLAVKKQEAAHLPRLDLVSSLSRSESDSSHTIGQQTTLRSVGVQLSVPLYSGGGIDASVRQSMARQSQANEEIRNEREALEVDVQKHFRAMVVGSEKIRAYLKAVDSTALAWQGARRSLELGLGTLSDVADAQAAHFSARRDLAQARIEQLVARVRLKVRAGVPMAEVAADLDTLLAAAPAPNTAPSKP